MVSTNFATVTLPHYAPTNVTKINGSLIYAAASIEKALPQKRRGIMWVCTEKGQIKPASKTHGRVFMFGFDIR